MHLCHAAGGGLGPHAHTFGGLPVYKAEIAVLTIKDMNEMFVLLGSSYRHILAAVSELGEANEKFYQQRSVSPIAPSVMISSCASMCPTRLLEKT